MSATIEITLPKALQTLERSCDTDEISRRLQEYAPVIAGGGATLQALEIPRVMMQRKGEITIQYVVSFVLAGSAEQITRHLCGRWYQDTKAVNEYRARLSPGNIYFEDLNLVIPLFPDDPDLESLQCFSRYDSRRESASALELEESARFIVSEVISYRLGRRCVLRGDFIDKDCARTAAFCKLVKPKRSRRLVERNRALEDAFANCSGGEVVIPEILFADSDRGVIINRAVVSTPLYDLIDKELFDVSCASAGAAICALHSASLSDLSQTTAIDELVESQRRSAQIARLFPELGRALMKRLESLEDRMIDISAPLAPCHGDYYDKQALYQDGALTMIDFDSLRLADPALDVGNFIAHLNLRGLQRHQSATAFDGAERAFLRSYGNKEAAFAERVRWWRVISLLRLVCVYVLRPKWKALAPRLLAEADRYMEIETRTSQENC